MEAAAARRAASWSGEGEGGLGGGGGAPAVWSAKEVLHVVCVVEFFSFLLRRRRRSARARGTSFVNQHPRTTLLPRALSTVFALSRQQLDSFLRVSSKREEETRARKRERGGLHCSSKKKSGANSPSSLRGPAPAALVTARLGTPQWRRASGVGDGRFETLLLPRESIIVVVAAGLSEERKKRVTMRWRERFFFRRRRGKKWSLPSSSS